MIKLKQLLPEISLMSGDAGSDKLKDIFDLAFRVGALPRKYKHLYWSDEDEAKGIPSTYVASSMTSKEKKEMERNKKLNTVSSDFLDYLDKYEKVGSSGNYTMILKKSSKEWNFLLCNKAAKNLTEFFIGVIKVEKGTRSYRFSAKNAFNLDVYQIHWSNIALELKGQGMGKLMYTMVYEYITGPLGGALLSDSMLFQGSQKMWMSYVPSIASYFGIVVEDIYFPIDKSEVGADVMGNNVDHMVAMETMPNEVRKLANNVKGLSFKRGEYGVIRVHENINKKLEKASNHLGYYPNGYSSYDEKTGKFKKPEKPVETYFSNIVDEANSFPVLIKRMEYDYDMNMDSLTSNTGEISNLKACVFAFDNMNVIVKQGAGKLIMVAI